MYKTLIILWRLRPDGATLTQARTGDSANLGKIILGECTIPVDVQVPVELEEIRQRR